MYVKGRRYIGAAEVALPLRDVSLGNRSWRDKHTLPIRKARRQPPSDEDADNLRENYVNDGARGVLGVSSPQSACRTPTPL